MMTAKEEKSVNDLILTPDRYFDRIVRNRTGITSGYYLDKIDDKGNPYGEVVRRKNGQPLESTVVVKEGSGKWLNSKPYFELWNKIESQINKLKGTRVQNVANFPEDYYDLIEMFRLDLTRRRMENIDFTTMLTTEITNPAFSRTVNLLEFMDFAGGFEQIKGSGDPVPLIEQKTGARGHVDISIYGLGHVRTLEDELYNTDIFSLQKVAAAVARGHIAARNQLSIGVLVAYSLAGAWDPAQQQLADLTGLTYDEQLYNTIRNGLRRLGRLRDYQTDNAIGITNAVLVVQDEVIAWDVGRVIRGQLATQGEAGASILKNVGPLPISEVWVYKGDAFDVGQKHYNYPGVPDGHAYLLIPSDGQGRNMFYTLSKRQLTQEVGRGDVLHLEREKKAWYFAQGHYDTEFFGNTGGLTGANNYGYAIEILFPPEET